MKKSLQHYKSITSQLLLPPHLIEHVLGALKEVRNLRALVVSLRRVKDLHLCVVSEVLADLGDGEHYLLQSTIMSHNLYTRSEPLLFLMSLERQYKLYHIRWLETGQHSTLNPFQSNCCCLSIFQPTKRLLLNTTIFEKPIYFTKNRAFEVLRACNQCVILKQTLPIEMSAFKQKE